MNKNIEIRCLNTPADILEYVLNNYTINFLWDQFIIPFYTYRGLLIFNFFSAYEILQIRQNR